MIYDLRFILRQIDLPKGDRPATWNHRHGHWNFQQINQ